MKKQFVEDLRDGNVVNDYFVATRKDLRDTQSGGKFLGMVFKDRSGEIGGVMWNNAVSVSSLFEVGEVKMHVGQVDSGPALKPRIALLLALGGHLGF